MLQYLIILLDDTSVSFCHHNNMKTERHPMPLEILREGIIFGMKENLRIQFVLPNYPLPLDYWREMMSIDHSIIVPGDVCYNELVPPKVFFQMPDVVVFEDIDTYLKYTPSNNPSYVLRVDKKTFFDNSLRLAENIDRIWRLNIVMSDIESFEKIDFEKYQECLEFLSDGIKRAYQKGNYPQVNVITDRIMLKEMNNCNAGVTNVTLAPNGKFYICPAFYQTDSSTPICDTYEIGSLQGNGLSILNSHLFKIECAPLCRICDAFQCKRCVWLNNKTTYEMNTPSHEQCVIAHLERNASRKLLNELGLGAPSFSKGIHIKEIDYLDPFEIKQEL